MGDFYHGSTWRPRIPDDILDELDALDDEHDRLVEDDRRIASLAFDEDGDDA